MSPPVPAIPAAARAPAPIASTAPGRPAAYAAALLAIVGWGSLYPVARLALRNVTPVMLAFDRAAIASLALAALTCLRAGGLRPGLRCLRDEARGAGGWIVVLGLLSFVATSLLAVGAQQLLPASLNSVLNNLAPLWLALYAAFQRRARRAGLLVGGSLLAALGVATVLLGDSFATREASAGFALQGTAWFGAALSLTGSALIAVSMLVARRVMPGRDAVAVTSVAAGCAALPLGALLGLGIGGSFGAFAGIGPDARALLLWLGTMSTAFNFTLWNYALSHLPVTRIAHFQYLIAPLGVVLAVVLLREPAGAGLVAGVAAIVAGIALAQRGAEPVGPA